MLCQKVSRPKAFAASAAAKADGEGLESKAPSWPKSLVEALSKWPLKGPGASTTVLRIGDGGGKQGC